MEKLAKKFRIFKLFSAKKSINFSNHGNGNSVTNGLSSLVKYSFHGVAILIPSSMEAVEHRG